LSGFWRNTVQLYNTLTRRKEEFTARADRRVGMYVCGITAYDYCHIGHARSAVAFDVLARLLRHEGFALTFVRNITDVDDKIINRANEQGRPCEDLAEEYTVAFHEDMDRLEVLRPDMEPRATRHIGEMIAHIEQLIAADKAYATPVGDVYFRVRLFAGYGRLSGRDPDDLRAGARVMPGEEKEDPLDFALWKAAKAGEPHWSSPWGEGRPGWHIECSAMSATCLGLPLDIHGGGLDLIFPHHENEIAQSEACCGHEMARFWVHNGFVQVNSEKMSKSLGNFTTIRQILADREPEVLRFFLLSKQYRSPIDFSLDSMQEAERGLKRIYECLDDAEKALERARWTPSPAGGEDPRAELEALHGAFMEAMRDDCNTAAAIGHIFTAVRLVNRTLDDRKTGRSESARDVCRALLGLRERWHGLLGALGARPREFLDRLKASRARRKGLSVADVETLLRQRQQARERKDFAGADSLRDKLIALGVTIRDGAEGSTWDIA
jgi:cysteinyl-tRNA synthetase